jgi:hypothetical protein
MARIQQISEIKPLIIDNFLGLSLPKAGDTQLFLGESGNMTNCYVTKDYDLSKMYGYKQLMTQIADKSIQGLWCGYISGTKYFVYAINGKLYKVDSQLWEDFEGTDVWSTVSTEIGSLTDAPTQFFAFDNKLYMINGVEYKSYDGTTLTDVSGYVPKIIIGAKPSTGSGTDFEGLNLLTGAKRLTYHGDGTATYQLPETAVTSVDKVYVNGTLKTLTTHYTVVEATGVVTFTAGNLPAEGLDNVEIYYTKGTGNRSEVVKNRFAFLFGIAKDTRVFLYGNEDEQNMRLHSSLADGVPSVEYFTADSLEPIGDSSTPITGMERHHNILLIHKPTETYYSYYDSVNLDGIDFVTFPASIINDSRGNVAMGQTRVLNNDPFTIDTQLIKWLPTDVKDERNMQDMGKRIQKDLDSLFLYKCLTADKEKTSELFISNGKKIWIYNYGLYHPHTQQQGIFSRALFKHEPTCWINIDGELWFGTTDGYIMKLSEDYITYNGEAIESHWEMNMYDFGTNYLNKTLNKSWITLSAQPKVQLDVQYITDKNAYSTPYELKYTLTTFDDVDFANFSFLTNYNPKTFYIRLKAKKFNYLKLVIDNDSLTETFSVLNLTLKAEYGNERK